MVRNILVAAGALVAAHASAGVVGADYVNILSLQPQTSASTDFTDALNAALAGTVPVFMPQTGVSYQINGTLAFGEGSSLVCDAGVQIISPPATTYIFNVTEPNVTIIGCTFIKPPGSANAMGVVSSNNFTWSGGGSSGTKGLFFDTPAAANGIVENTLHVNGAASVIILKNGASNNSILNNEFENNAGFGVLSKWNANSNTISGNWTFGNGIELIAIAPDSWGNLISNNRAQGTGDNCISIDGYNNVVTGNSGYHCAFHGLAIYGNNNIVTGNVMTGNGQSHNPLFAFYNKDDTANYSGVLLYTNFGGAAQNNHIRENVVDDDQQIPTQAYGIGIGNSYYLAWAPGVSYPAGRQIYAQTTGNIYQANDVGVSGPTEPGCAGWYPTSCSDGAMTWAYQGNAPLQTNEPAGNMITGNLIRHYGVAPFNDLTTNHNNVYVSRHGRPAMRRESLP